MSIANYTTTVSAEKTAGEIMSMLAKHDATNISITYEDSVAVGMTFTLSTEFGPRSFQLPVRANGVAAAMQNDGNVPQRFRTMGQASRVAWRIARDWLRAQLALIDAGLSSMDEVMMPWMLSDGGQTMFDAYQRNQRQIEATREE